MSTLASLQTTLAGEHAAVFVYGDLGAHTSQSAQPELFGTISLLYRAHRARRDQLRLLISDRGAVPVASEASYDLPGSLGTSQAVRRVALRTEQACAETYAAMVANTAGTERIWAISALGEAALVRVELGGRLEAFPGAPDLSR